MRRFIFLALALIFAIAVSNVEQVQAKVQTCGATASLAAADVSPGTVATSLAVVSHVFVVPPAAIAATCTANYAIEVATGEPPLLRCSPESYFIRRQLNTTGLHIVTTKGRTLRC